MDSMLKILLLVFLPLVFHCQIIAIDFGTENIKVSLVQSNAGKSFTIVENHKSDRKFLNSIGFFQQERHYQTASLSKRSKLPQNCFLYSRLLIDLAKNAQLMQTLKKEQLLEYINSETQDQKFAGFVLANFPQTTKSITLLQVIAMMLKYVKAQADKFAKANIKDAVLMVPNFWGVEQRQYLLKAAKIAGIHVLSLLSENTGAAIHYSIKQRNTNKTQKVLFYNVGANALQMTLAEYKGIEYKLSPKPIESVFVIADYGVPYVGGLRFNSIIAEYFIQKFQEKYKKPLNKRGRIKLMHQIPKVKEVLTSNKDANIFVEGIMDGIDFQSTITRQLFERRSSHLFQQLIDPIKSFLLINDYNAGDLDNVELIGGGVRIPRLQEMIRQALQNKPQIGTHINGDEAAALGGAFYATNSSKKFKVKGIHLYDGFNFDVRLVLRNENEDIKQGDEGYYYKNVTLFRKKSRFGLHKQVTFRSNQNIIAEVYKEDEKEISLLRRYEVRGIKQMNQSDFKVALSFTLNPIEIVTLDESEAVYKKEQITSYLEKVRKTKNQNSTKIKNKSLIQDQKDEIIQSIQAQQTTEATKQVQQTQAKQPQQEKKTIQKIKQRAQTQKEQTSQQQQSIQQQQKQPTSENRESIQQNQNTESQEKEEQKVDRNQLSKQNKASKDDDKQTEEAEKKENKNSTKKKPKKDKKQKIQYQTVTRNKTVSKKYEKPLPNKEIFSFDTVNQAQLQNIKTLMASYEIQEKQKHNLAEARNKLESLIYDTREKLSNDEFTNFAQEKEKQKISKLVAEKGEWYEQTTSTNTQEYRTHYRQLNDTLSKVTRRIKEHHDRDEVLKKALAITKEYLNLTNSIRKGKEWITEQQVAELEEEFANAENQIQLMYDKMQQAPLNQDGIYRNKDMLKQAEKAKDKYFVLKTKQKPKQNKTVEEESSSTDDQTTGKTNNEQDKNKKDQESQKQIPSDEL